MKITDEAKVLLEKVMAADNFNCIMAGLDYSCCGGESNIVFGLGTVEDGDTVYEINGIKCVMEEETFDRAEVVTIYAEADELMFLDEGASECGCKHEGGDHHDHNHDENHDCECGGHHHEHEEGHECKGGGHHHEHEEGHECKCGHHHEDKAK